MSFVTLEQVKRAAQEIVAEFGEDYVYEHDVQGFCHYQRDGQPSCLVGRIFHRLGVSIGLLEKLEGTGPGSLFHHEEWEAGDGVVNFLANLQLNQDSGHTWGVSYRNSCNGKV